MARGVGQREGTIEPRGHDDIGKKEIYGARFHGVGVMQHHEEMNMREDNVTRGDGRTEAGTKRRKKNMMGVTARMKDGLWKMERVSHKAQESLLLADIRAFDKWRMLRETETVVKTFDGYDVRKDIVNVRQMCMASPKTKEEMEEEEMRLKIHAEQKAALLHRLRGKDAVPSEYVTDNVRVCLGSSTAARNLKALERCGVTHVLNISAIVPCYFVNLGVEYMKIPVFDDDAVDIVQYFPEAFDFIDEGCKQGCVFVHCCAGQSRSVAFVIGYLMSRKGMDFEKAWRHVKGVRACAAPNEGFLRQLQQLSRKISRQEQVP